MSVRNYVLVAVSALFGNTNHASVPDTNNKLPALMIQAFMCEDRVCENSVDCPQILNVSVDGFISGYRNLHVEISELPVKELIIVDSVRRLRYTDLDADGTLDLIDDPKQPGQYRIVSDLDTAARKVEQVQFVADEIFIASCLRRNAGYTPV